MICSKIVERLARDKIACELDIVEDVLKPSGN
jgi:hypothetical protein